MLDFLFGPKITSISTSELEGIVKRKAGTVLDVREVHEFRGGHIPVAKNAPLSNLENSVKSIKKDEKLYVICQSGMRSKRASKLLTKLGYTNVTNVSGGMSMWRGTVK